MKKKAIMLRVSEKLRKVFVMKVFLKTYGCSPSFAIAACRYGAKLNRGTPMLRFAERQGRLFS